MSEMNLDLFMKSLQLCFRQFSVIDKSGQTVFAEIQGYVRYTAMSYS